MQKRRARIVLVFARPLNATERLEPFPAHAPVHRRQRAQLVPRLLRRRDAEVAAQPLRQLADDPDVVLRVARRVERLPAPLHPPLAVRHRAVRLDPARRRGQHHVGHQRRLGEEDVLHDEVLEPFEQLQRMKAVGFRLRRVLAIATVEDIDRQLTGYYREHRYALVVSIVAAWLAWVLGALELWLILHALGAKFGFADVWIMEAFVQSVRAASFFIPAALGTQEAAMLVMIHWLSGAHSVGIATALVRRARELLWIVASLLLSAACAATPHRVGQLDKDD